MVLVNFLSFFYNNTNNNTSFFGTIASVCRATVHTLTLAPLVTTSLKYTETIARSTITIAIHRLICLAIIVACFTTNIADHDKRPAPSATLLPCFRLSAKQVR